MTDDACVTLVQSLCTRLCHDLAGPVGAIGTGVELLAEEDGVADPQIVGLLSDSAAGAASRLRILRAMLGLPTGKGLDPAEAHRLLADHLAGGSGAQGQAGGPAVTWDVPLRGADEAPVRAHMQLVLVLCVVGTEALPRAERVAVAAPHVTRAAVRISGAGPVRDGSLAAIREALAGAPPPQEPRAILGAYAGLLARTRGLTVTVETVPGVLHLDVRPIA